MICTNPGDPLGSNRGNVLLVAVLRTRFPGLLSGEGDAEARSVLESFVTSAKQTQGKRRDERPRLILRTFFVIRISLRPHLAKFQVGGGRAEEDLGALA